LFDDQPASDFSADWRDDRRDARILTEYFGLCQAPPGTWYRKTGRTPDSKYSRDPGRDGKFKLDFAMIKGFVTPHPLEPENPGHLQWGPAFLAGLIAGSILLFVPRGSPWSSGTFFDQLIMGRALPAGMRSWIPVWLIHLIISMFYGVLIALGVARLRAFRAVLTGGLIAIILYVFNLLAVSIFLPEMRGNELSALLTHFVFGLLAAASYRGLLRRKSVPSQPAV
jgi:hypothetical protein